MITNSKILITGGLGFIGSHLINFLRETNEIYVIDKADICGSSFDLIGLSDHQNIKVIKADLYEDLSTLKDLPNDFNYIIHAAGILGIQNVIDNPYETVLSNGLGAINIAKFCRGQKKLKKFLFFSTSEIYGINANKNYENSPAILPSEGIRWCYAVSKFYGEYVFKGAHKKFALPYSVVRPFNIYGPYRSGTNAITSFVKNSLNNKDINITGDGLQQRCWCYIDDFISGIVKILENQESIGNAFNIGNDSESISIVDLAKQIISITGSKSSINIGTEHIEDVSNRKPNIEKAKEILGYNARVNLEEGLLLTIDWHRSL